MIIGLDASRVDQLRMTGTERYAREVLRAMLRLAPAQYFRIYARSTDALSSLDATHAELVHIERTRLWTHLGLGHEILRQPPDALFIPAHVLPLVFATRTLRERTRAVVTVHDCGFRHFPRAHTATQRMYLHWSTSFAAQHAHALLADSEATMSDMHRFYPRSRGKTRVAHPGAPQLLDTDTATIAAACARVGVQPHAFILHVGTRQPRKNLRRLIDAWAIARTRMPAHFKLLLAGGAGWGGEDLAAHADARGVHDSVLFPGYVSDEEKSALLRAARALAFPSLHEGFGFPVLEAQMAGTPIACSNTSSLPEVSGAAALLFDPLQVHAIADALLAVALDDVLRMQLIERGAHNAARFTWTACAQTALQAIEGAQQ